MRVRLLTNKPDILHILQHDSIYAAYAIGDLADGFFEKCQWAVAEDSHQPRALAMTFNGLQPPALFLMGDNEGLQSLLRQGVCPQHAYLTMRPENVPAVAHIYNLAEKREMWRMSVERSAFRPVLGRQDMARLRPVDIDALNQLYSWGGAAFFSAYQLEQGVYYAAHRNGGLVAAAGTHIVSPEYGIAAVGNVYTHPDYRNRGLATACTSAVVAELFRLGCTVVVLNVRQDNLAAVRAYAKLGFRIYCPFVEAPGRIKNSMQRLLSKITTRSI